jgi:hypothetical protein
MGLFGLNGLKARVEGGGGDMPTHDTRAKKQGVARIG